MTDKTTKTSSSGDWRFCVAPMMDWTDSRCRVFHRLMTRRARLYTEMLTTGAIINGDRQRLLGFDASEHPVALQLGGSNPRDLASAAIDVSDGLIADLGHLAGTSKVKIELDAEAIPRSDALRAFWGDGPDAILRAATAGDDYQIAFTALPGLSGPFSRIGKVQAGEGITLASKGEQIAIPKPGYRHF